MSRSDAPDDLRRLEREAERNRSDLTQTIDELRGRVSETTRDLRERVSPDHIRADVRNYVQQTGENFRDTLEHKVRENPLQALAIGAGLAYPLWRMIRNIPAPILLIGAGVALSRPGNLAALNRSASQATDHLRAAGQDIADKVGEITSHAQDAVSAQAAKLGDQAQSTMAAVSGRLSAVTDKAQSGVETARSAAADQATSAQSVAQDVMSRASDMASGVAERASSAYNSGVQAATETYASGLESASQGWQQAASFGQQAQRGVADAFKENPLIVAGLAFVVGATIAAALPMTETEDQLLGEAGSSLKAKAADLASQGYDQARETVSRVYDQTLSQAKDQGLTADALSDAATQVGEKVRAVAGKAAETAGLSGGQVSDNQPATHGSQT